MSFIHLRTTSAYSFKYGTTMPDDLVARAAEFEMPALALTDRDSFAGTIRFAKSCLAYGIAPIIGINLQIDLVNSESVGVKADRKNFPRVTILAGSDGGYRNLMHLYRGITFHSPDRIPVITMDILEKFHQQSGKLYLLHGPESPVSQAIGLHRFDLAMEIFNKTRPFFADQAIECVSHLVAGSGPRSTAHAARSLVFAREHDIDAIVTNAVRMRDRSDGPVADILDCARQLVPLDRRHLERRNGEAFLKDSNEMYRLAAEIAQAAGEGSPRLLLKSTREWAERSLLSPQRDIGLGDVHLPEADVVGAANAADMRRVLRERSEAGLHWRYTDSDRIRIARARLDDELATVATLGFESYFLTVADITDMARDKGIRVAARGSGAGSLICHLLGISGVDPIEHGLLMERFCSPLRRALPDIDIDVESARRLEIYDAIFARYGAPSFTEAGAISRCATVSMVETYRARHAIRDAGAALGLPAVEIDLLAKSMPHVRAANIEAALASLPELKSLNTNTPLMAMTIAMAARLDGLPRHLAMHPCAIALSDATLLDRTPLQINAGGYPMLEFDKDDVEDIGLLKLDVLGVRMQSAIAHAVEEIRRTADPEFDIDAVPLDDPDTYKLIQSTQTLGLFQIESPGQRELVGKLQPRTFNDLVIDISLFRPGPVKSDMIRPFLEARGGFTAPQLIHPTLAPILAETEGVVVFHEQVIAIISVMTGISLAAADEKRRALGSKEGQQQVCDWFFPAATGNGYELTTITTVWDILRAFASFGFCKAHAAAFALPTYQSAWLKTHYPAAFIAGVLTHDPGMYPKRLMIDEARQMGVPLAPLDINFSSGDYRVEMPDGETFAKPAIRIALSAVSGASEKEIVSITAGQPYIDLADFYRRSGASSPTIETLILTGAFDAVHIVPTSEGGAITHRDLLLHLADLQKTSAPSLSGAQMSLALAPPILEASGLPAMSSGEKMANELSRLGMDISEHLLSPYAEFLNAIGATRSCDLLKARSNSAVLVAGVKVALQSPPVRSGKRVLFLSLDDGYGCSDATFFPDVLQSRAGEYAQTLYATSLFLVRGVTRRTGERGISIRATGVWDLRSAYHDWNLKKGSVAI
ncbi:MAG: DNA polymerase III subunit alpha [Candidatus Planktophila sp.]|nr:DNA polymerase III subunit alpha [Candidatus Planktophila sp.]